MTDIEQVKSKLDIVEVVRSYVPTLKRTGRSWKANCPFHKEKSPSFIVTPELQRYKCFGCGESGDALTFIMKMERAEFPEALRIAAERAGVELSKQVYSEKEAELKKQKERLYELNRLAMEYWHYILSTHAAGKIGRDYTQKRQIRGEELKKFKLGYAPAGTNLLPFLHKKGYANDEIVRAGLAITRDNGQTMDKFRDRLILPIFDMKGNAIGFSGRIVQPNEFAPKYLNSPETIVYRKGDILMGLYHAKQAARDQKFLILEEGNIDILSSHKVGVENIAATGGTALTESQLKLVMKYADVVYFCFDTDEAGTKALIKGVELAERVGLKHKALDIGEFQDPDALISRQPARWSQVIANPQNSVELLLKRFSARLDLGTADGKSELVELMLPILRSLHDEVQRTHFANQLAMLVNVSAQVITEQLQSAKPQQLFPDDRHERTDEVAHNLDDHVTNRREEYLIALLIQLDNIQDQAISLEAFTDPSSREILAALLNKGNASYDFADISSSLSDQAVSVLQSILAIDITDVQDIAGEFLRLYRILYGNFLRKQILELRQGLQADSGDEQVLAKLQYFTKELSALG